jgi:hypothetical protein
VKSIPSPGQDLKSEVYLGWRPNQEGLKPTFLNRSNHRTLSSPAGCDATPWEALRRIIPMTGQDRPDRHSKTMASYRSTRVIHSAGHSLSQTPHSIHSSGKATFAFLLPRVYTSEGQTSTQTPHPSQESILISGYMADDDRFSEPGSLRTVLSKGQDLPKPLQPGSRRELLL